MSLTLLQKEMLVRFGQFSRNAQFFSSAGKGVVGLAPPVAQRNLDELAALGYIAKIKTGYKLTDAGRNRLDGPGTTTAPTRITNAGQPNMHKLPLQMTSHRPGANDHEKHASFGTLC